jgi:hypothetical protein
MKLPKEIIDYTSNFLDCGDLLNFCYSANNIHQIINYKLEKSRTDKLKSLETAIYRLYTEPYLNYLTVNTNLLSDNLSDIFKYENIIRNSRTIHSDLKKQKIIQIFRQVLYKHGKELKNIKTCLENLRF